MMMTKLGTWFLKLLMLIMAGALAGPAWGADWYVAVDGKAEGAGTKESPWDIASALAGRHAVAGGDTIWIAGGTYRHPDRKRHAKGFGVSLAGAEGKPLHVRPGRGQRVTIDGGLRVDGKCHDLWMWGLEIIVSENLTKDRWFKERGSHPRSHDRPWGGLEILGGKRCKYINMVVHHNMQGIGFWRGAVDSELHGCIVYANGWKAPDRSHGHCIYAQNQDGTKTISDCILRTPFGRGQLTIQAYGSRRAYVDNFVITGNVVAGTGRLLVGGGRPSRNIRVSGNYLYGCNLQLGYSAPHNEDCAIHDNTVVNGRIAVNRYRKADRKNNLVIPDKKAPRPEGDPLVAVRPNKYDRSRAHVVIYNWRGEPTVNVDASRFLKTGETYRLMSPWDVFGKPVLTGACDGKAIPVPIKGEFAVFVLLKASDEGARKARAAQR